MNPIFFILYIASVSLSLGQIQSTQGNRESLSNSPSKPDQISSLKPAKQVDANHALLSTFERNPNGFPKTPTPTLLGIAKLPEPLFDPGVRRTKIRNIFKKPTNPQDLIKSSRLDTFLPPGLDFLSPIQKPEVKQSQLSNKGGFLIEPKSQKLEHSKNSKNWKSMVKTNQRQVGDPVAIVLEKSNAGKVRSLVEPALQVSNSKPSFTNVDSVHGQLRNGDSMVISNNNVGNEILSFDQIGQESQVANGISNSENLPSKEGNLDLPWVQQDPWDLKFLTKQADSGIALPWFDPNANKETGHNGNLQNSLSNTNVNSLKPADTTVGTNLKQRQHNSVNITQNNKSWSSWVEPPSMNDLQHNVVSSWTSTSLQNEVSQGVFQNSASNQTKRQSKSSIASESAAPTEIIKTDAVSSKSDMQNSNNFFANWDPWGTETVSQDITPSEDPNISQRIKGFVDQPQAKENQQTKIPSPPAVGKISNLNDPHGQGKSVVDNQPIKDKVESQASTSLNNNALSGNKQAVVSEPGDIMNKQLPDKSSLSHSSSLLMNKSNTVGQTGLLKDSVFAIHIPAADINLTPLIDNVGSEIQHANHRKGILGSIPTKLLINENSLKQNGEKIMNKPLVDGNIFSTTLQENVTPITGMTNNLDKHLNNNPIADIKTEEKPLHRHNALTTKLPKNKQVIVSSPLIADPNLDRRTNVRNDKPLRDINSVIAKSTKQLSKINIDISNSNTRAESMDAPMRTPILDNLNLVDQTTKAVDKPLGDNGPVNIIKNNFVGLKAQGRFSEAPFSENMPNEATHVPKVQTLPIKTIDQSVINPSLTRPNKIMPISNASLRDHKNTILTQQINQPIKLQPTEPAPSNSLTLQRNEDVEIIQNLKSKQNKHTPKISAFGTALSTSSKTATKLDVIKPIELDKKQLNVKEIANLDFSQNEQLKQGESNNIDLSVTIEKLKSLANSNAGIGTQSSTGNKRPESVVVVVKKEKTSSSDVKNNTDDTQPGHLTTHNSIFFDPKTNQEIDPFRQVTREVLENAKKAWTNALATVGSSHLRVGSIPTRTTPFAVSSNSHRRSTSSRHAVNNPLQNNGQNLNFNSGDISFLDPITEGEVLRLNVPNTSRRRIQRQRPQQHQHPDPNIATAPDNVFIGPFLVGPVDHPSGDIEFSGTLLVPAPNNAGTSVTQQQAVFIPNTNSIQDTHSQAQRPLIPRPFTRQTSDGERPQQSPVPDTNTAERLSALARLTMLTRSNNAHISNLQAASLRRQGNPLVSRLGSANTPSTSRNGISQLREVVSRIVNSNTNTQSRSQFSPSLSASSINVNHNGHPLQMSSARGRSRFQHVNNRVSNRDNPFISRNPAINPPINNLLQNQPARQGTQSNHLIRLIAERLRSLSRRSEGQVVPPQRNNNLFSGQAFDMRTLLRNISVPGADSDVRSLRNIVPARTPLSVSPRLETQQLSNILPTSRIAMPTMVTQQRIIGNPSGPIWNFNAHARAIPSMSGLPQRSDFVHTPHSPWLNNRIVQINQPPVIL